MFENLAHQMAMSWLHPMAVNLAHPMAVRWLRAEGLDPRLQEAASGEGALSRRTFSQVYRKKVNIFCGLCVSECASHACNPLPLKEKLKSSRMFVALRMSLEGEKLVL
jgi:hypothetical protein